MFNIICPLCLSPKVTLFHKDKNREYLLCSQCKLVFVPKKQHISQTKEKSVYDQHENNPNDQAYRNFLSKLAYPILSKIGKHKYGLDFGCGPGPTLSKIMEEAGHTMEIYDPYYFNEPKILTKKYDFVLSTEVAEHISKPGKVFQTLFKILKPRGWLGIMTKQVIDQESFKKWHYILDMTHISFYSKDTFKYIAKEFNTKPLFYGDDIVLFKKE